MSMFQCLWCVICRAGVGSAPHVGERAGEWWRGQVPGRISRYSDDTRVPPVAIAEIDDRKQIECHTTPTVWDD